jgi:hypothetical protein
METRVRVRLRLAIDPEQVAASYDAILTALERGHGRAAGNLIREHAEMFAPSVDEPAGG